MTPFEKKNGSTNGVLNKKCLKIPKGGNQKP